MDNEDCCNRAESDDHGPVHPAEHWVAVESDKNAREETSQDKGEDSDVINSQPKR